jgi:hypothetical protein
MGHKRGFLSLEPPVRLNTHALRYPGRQSLHEAVPDADDMDLIAGAHDEMRVDGGRQLVKAEVISGRRMNCGALCSPESLTRARHGQTGSEQFTIFGRTKNADHEVEGGHVEPSERRCGFFAPTQMSKGCNKRQQRSLMLGTQSFRFLAKWDRFVEAPQKNQGSPHLG